MRYRCGSIAILSVLMIASGCNHQKDQAQGGTALPATPQGGPLKVKDNTPPRLVVEKTTYEFEKMEQFKLGAHVFEIRNEGKGELFLRIQHTSCGCTSVKLGEVEWDPKHPAPKTIVSVLPGAKVDVEMNWDTGERSGDFRTTANIESNDPKLPIAAFTVQGEIVPYIQVTQTQVKMDEIRNGEVTTAHTYLYSKKFDDLELTEVNSSNPLVTADFEPAEDVVLESMKALSGVKATIKTLPGLPIGPFTASLTFKTNKQERPELTVSVIGHVLGDVLLSPNENIDFGIVKVSEGKTQTLFVKIIGDEPVDVKIGRVKLVQPDVSGTGPGLPVESEILKVTLDQFTSSKNRWQLKAQVPQGSPGGKFKGVIELETTHPTAKLVKIPVRFEVTK